MRYSGHKGEDDLKNGFKNDTYILIILFDVKTDVTNIILMIKTMKTTTKIIIL